LRLAVDLLHVIYIKVNKIAAI
jgi:hypothetical protein